MALQNSYYPADQSLGPVQEMTVGGMLRDAAQRWPDAIGMIEGAPGDPPGRRRWTFSQMLAQSEALAGALLARFEPGDRVAVWAPNMPEWALVEFGAALAGIVLVTVNPAYRPKELAYVLAQSGASGIFLVPEFRGSPMLSFLDEVRPDLPALREVLLFSDWDALLASAPPEPKLPEVLPGDPVQIQYTSGTTGFPKGALLHHRGLTNNARFYAKMIGLAPGDKYLNPLPMFHTAGCVVAALGSLSAGAAHIPVGFEPGVVLELLESEQVPAALLVPTMWIACLEHPDLTGRDYSALRIVGSGGSTVPAELVRRVESTFGAEFIIVYGTTECSPLITQVRSDDAPADKTDTLGRPVPQVEVKVTDPATGEIAPVGAVGELCVRGYNVMTGYYDMPEATAQAIDADGWYHTGDLASMDDRGFCRIEGRLKDMIIRGGENIYPREIEELLFHHDKVADVAVVGVPDEKWGEIVVAFIRAAPSGGPTEEELFAFCREHLAPHKTPKQWVFVDSFPLTPSGKIQKFKLRDQFKSATGP